jgi:hypothetical protein
MVCAGVPPIDFTQLHVDSLVAFHAVMKNHGPLRDVHIVKPRALKRPKNADVLGVHFPKVADQHEGP